MSKRTIAIVASVAVLAAAAGAVAFAARDRDSGDDDMMGMSGRGHGWQHGRRGDGDGMMGMGEGRGGGWRHRFGGNISKEDFDARSRERFARFDKNSDGVIDRAEIEEAQSRNMERRERRVARMMAGMLKRMGADADGKLAKAAFLDQVKVRFAQLDLDGDGRITDADLPPMMRGRGALTGEDGAGRGPMMGHGRRGRGGQLMGMVREAAKKGDGTASLDGVLAIAETRFKSMDRNADGVIDASDGEAMRKEMAAYRVDRFLHRFGARQTGKITREQFEKVAAERFAMRDVDGDGTIERGERGGRHGGWHGRGRGHGEGGSMHGEGRGRGPGGGQDGDEAPREGGASKRN